MSSYRDSLIFPFFTILPSPHAMSLNWLGKQWAHAVSWLRAAFCNQCSCTDWQLTGQIEQRIVEFLLRHFLSWVNNVFSLLLSSYNSAKNYVTPIPLQPPLLCQIWQDLQVQSYWKRKADHTAYTWLFEVVRLKEIRK